METQDRTKIILIAFVCCVCLLVHCQNQAGKQHISQMNAKDNVSSEVIKNKFVDLANAIKIGDCERLKAYFTFPVANQYIWYKVLSDNEIERTNIAKLFTEKDFEHYCNKFFDTEIETSINTINIEAFSNDNLTSDTVVVRDGIYLNKCVLSINFNNDSVLFSVLSNIYDENEEFLSEHVDKYYFTLVDNKLMFSNFEMID